MGRFANAIRAIWDFLFPKVTKESPRSLRELARDAINAQKAAKKRMQDACPHRSRFGTTRLVLVQGDDTYLLCQKCQKQIFPTDRDEYNERFVEAVGFADVIRGSFLDFGREIPTAEEERLYKMPLEDLRKLATGEAQ